MGAVAEHTGLRTGVLAEDRVDGQGIQCKWEIEGNMSLCVEGRAPGWVRTFLPLWLEQAHGLPRH